MTVKARVENKLDEIELKKTDEIVKLNERIDRLTKDKKELKAKWKISAQETEKVKKLLEEAKQDAR
jgi:hypothetical protein